MTYPRRQATLHLWLSALAGLTSPLTLSIIFLPLGSTEVALVEFGVRHLGITNAGIRLVLETVDPCIDAIICAAAFGFPLGWLADGKFLRCWALFVLGAVVAHAVAALFVPSFLGGFWQYMGTMLLPFWWLFIAMLLGFMTLTARLQTRPRHVPSHVRANGDG